MNKITLVKGNNSEEITKKVISLISVDLSSKNYIIVPDRYSLIVESMLFDVLNISATFNIKVLGINKLAKTIIKECGLEDFSYSKEESLLFIRKAISDCADNFICFKKQLSVGFCEEIFSSITQFKTNKLSVEDVKELANSSTEGMKEKLTDLSLIYESYEKYLAGKLDAAEVLNLFETQIQNSKIICESNFYFVGFDSFTKQGYSLIAKLAKHSCSVTVGAFAPKNQKNKFLYDLEVVNNITEFANNNECEVSTIECYEDKNTISSQIVNNLYLSNPTPLICEKQPVVISECYGIEDEVHFAIKTIKNLLIKGYNFKDFNIACPIEKYKKVLKNKFNLCNFPYFLDESVSLFNTEPVRAIYSLIKFFNNYYESSVFGVLKNSYFNDDIELIEKIENICLKNNLKFPYVLDFDFEINEEEKLKLNLLFSKIKNIFEAYKNLKNIKNYIEFIKKIYNLFDFDNKIQEKINILKNIDIKTEKIYLQIKSSFEEVLNVLSLISDKEITGDEFLELFVFSLKNKNINTIPLSTNSVFIGDGETGFFEKKKFLIVLGANQGELPSTLNDCGVISDKEIDELKNKVQITPTIAMINRRKRFKVYDLLSNFSQKLFVSYLAADSDGSKNFPSSFIDSLKKMFVSDKGEYKIHYPSSDLYFISNIVDNESFSKLKYSITNLQSAKIALSDLIKNKNYEMAKLLYSAIHKLDENFVLEIKTDQEKPKIENASELFFNNDKTKISQLEKYFHCPYEHFMDYGLKLKEREKAKVEARNIGSLLHSIAELFCKFNKNSLGSMTLEDIEKSVNKIINNLSNQKENIWINFSENKYLSMLLQKEAKNLCVALNKQQRLSLFKPKYFEKRFFENSEFKPLKVGGLNLIGIVDRIDVYEKDEINKYFRVIDYKTGKIEAGYSSVYFGDKIQLFIYQKAIEQNLKLKPAGNLYFSIKDKLEKENENSFNMEGVLLSEMDILTKMDLSVGFDKPSSEFLPFKISTSKENLKSGELVPIKSTSLISSQDFEDISNYVIRLVENAIEEIKEGYIQTTPIKNECKYCKYAYACGFSSVLGNRERKQSSKNVDLESFCLKGDEDETK